MWGHFIKKHKKHFFNQKNTQFDIFLLFININLLKMNAKRRTSDKKKKPLEKVLLVELVWKDLVKGLSRYEILRKLENDGYKGFKTSEVSRTSRYNYLQEAYENAKGELREEKEKQRDMFYERVLSVYKDALNSNDRKNALKALDMAIKLSGLYAEEKKDITLRGDIKATINFGLEEEENED